MNSDVAHGLILSDMGRYRGCIGYFENLLNNTVQSDRDKYMIFCRLAALYSYFGQHLMALKYAKRSISLRTVYSTDFCDDMERFGTIFANVEAYDAAFWCFEIAMKNANNILEIAQLHSHLGKFYCTQKTYVYALKHCRQSLEIYNEFFADYFSILADTLYDTIGTVYCEMNNYQMAIEYFHKALSIRQSKYPRNHWPSITLYTSLCYCYYGTEQYDLLEEYSKKLLELE
ncbi:unnamed protein product [Didymodactylos carnosus]|uniref:Tetratricopeptide repeat protein n=1 Tax=Didymodactylos carnosus TaxID=1234261 RepID=A0A815NTE0_9BILA|nr:unnamed protein product [Didymodactylos carnosus]CAF1438891.1 unnamed protein product [Didymodactylos carnosus]CAF4111978.1 unnamed protein product [Didymodactylos carnosus]CAF4315673.1 unnamed protein product [Didymodactylos carnosus]